MVWVPHQGLEAEYRGKEREVLAGRTGLIPLGEDWELGDIDDDWALKLSSPEQFPSLDFGILLSP